jgi:DNA polymerase-3 subunit gamma/tau
MTYEVLARKKRPQTFDEVIGQTTVTRTLKNALRSGRIGHAFLFSGARGVGKTTTARILAKALNCSQGEGPAAEPCNACASCVEIAKGASLDVQEIDGATNNSVDQVRELRESARYNPARDRFKVWIIDEVHMLSTGAFNALLKTLEEPPPRVKFIFATTEYHKLPDTILSRCQQYDFRLIPARELLQHLRQIADAEGIHVSDEALARVARAAEGSARDALSLFDQVLSFSGGEVRDEDISALLGLIDRELLLGASQAVVAGDSLALLELVERLSDYGADYRNYTRELLLHFRELLLLKLAPAESPLLAGLVPEERERLRPLAAAFSEEDLLRVFDVLARLEGELRQATDPRVTLELALLKLVQLRRLRPFAELVAKVEGLAGGASDAPTPVVSARARAPEPPARVSAPAPRPAAPPPPAPAPAAPAVASPADADALLARMQELVRTRSSLAMPLRGAQARLHEGALLLDLDPAFVAMATAHLDEYQAVAREAAGRALRVRFGAAESTSPAPAPGAAPARRDDGLMDAAASDPAVREALDLFNGKVVSVRAEPE